MRIRFPVGNLGKWRMEEKARLLEERGWQCERPGCPNPCQDLDEGIIPKAFMGGFSKEQKRLAFCNINLFLLCAKCNREEAHQREWAFNQSCERYGEKAVREWYASLNLKAPRADFMP